MALSLDRVFCREFERRDGSVLTISQCEVGDVGCVVWDAALVLASFLQTDTFRTHYGGLSGKAVVELGAGTGLVGLQAAAEGADATVTDLEDFVPLMRKNAEDNAHVTDGRTRVCSLKWGEEVCDELISPDFILLADCIYYDESLEPLIKTLHDISGPRTCVLCCYEERLTDHKVALEKKFHKLVQEYFTSQKVPLDWQDPVYRSEDIHIYEFRKK